MQQTNYIKTTEIESLKQRVKSLYEQGKPINVNVKKTRTKGEKHDVVIAGVYQKFFTVKNEAMNLFFSIQYVDVLTGGVVIGETSQPEN